MTFSRFYIMMWVGFALTVSFACESVAQNQRDARDVGAAQPKTQTIQPVYIIEDSLGQGPHRDPAPVNDFITITADASEIILADAGPGEYVTQTLIHVVIATSNPNWRLECRLNSAIQLEDHFIDPARTFIRRAGGQFVNLTQPVQICDGQGMPQGGALDLELRVQTQVSDPPGEYLGGLEFRAYIFN